MASNPTPTRAYKATDLAAGRRIAERALTLFATCPIPEIKRLGTTLKRWRTRSWPTLTAHHKRGCRSGWRVAGQSPAEWWASMGFLGVDEHVWRHTRRGDKYVTVIIDLTPVRDGTGPSRLLDMIPGRTKHAFKQWLAARPQAWRESVEVVAMDGFTGFKTAAAEELPAAVAVMDSFHVVHLVGQGLDLCRRRTQLVTCGHRGHKNDPLYRAPRTLHTGADLLTYKQAAYLDNLFANDVHIDVELTWGIYQRVIEAYRDTNKARGKRAMTAVIACLVHDVPAALTELATPGRTLKKRAADIPAYFDHPGSSN